jgi:prepilin-type N-terminal cleavage/methylation domain-containing protein
MNARRSEIHGFTLVEMMVAVTIGALVMILILASFRSISTSLVATEHYRDMHHDLRHATDVMRRDLARSSGVSQYNATNQLTLVTKVPGAGTSQVVYSLASNLLDRTVGSSPSETLSSGVDELEFTLYDQSGVITATPANAYFVEVKIAVKKQGVRDAYTDVIQTRIRMRAKGL